MKQAGFGKRLQSFREARGMTQQDVADELLKLAWAHFELRVGVDRQMISKWEREVKPPSRTYQELLCLLYGTTSEELGFRPTIARQSRFLSPIEASNIEDADSLISWVTKTGTSNVAIEQIARSTIALAETHTQMPAKTTLKEALRLHQQARHILKTGNSGFRQSRELIKIDSDLLAHICLLLGDLRQDATADQYGIAALIFAQEAESNRAIALSARAKTLRWQERFIESADLARQGYDCSPPTPIRTQLASQEANAAALLGDEGRAREALNRAEIAAETVTSDSGISAWSFATGRQALFALAVATELGDADAALDAASMADAGWAAGEAYVPATWAQIRVGAGIAHLMHGSLDGAIEEVTPMLSLRPGLRVATVTNYVENLNRRLDTPRFRKDKQAIELIHRLREFNATALSDDQPEMENA